MAAQVDQQENIYALSDGKLVLAFLISSAHAEMMKIDQPIVLPKKP